MHKKLIAVLTVFLIIVIAVSTVIVYAADDDLYKNLNETAQQSKDDYFIKYRGNYDIDTEEMSFFKNPGSVTMALLTNALFSLQKLLATLTISVFSFALSTNISVLLGEFLEPFISAMKVSLWDNFAAYAIVFAAFVLILKMAQNRTSQALSSLIGVILVIVMAFIFYAYPNQMLKGIDTVTSGVSDEVMEGPYQVAVGGTAGDAKGKAASLCWNLFVHKPWQILEFGSVSSARKYEADILKLKPDSEEREELVKTLADSQGLFSKSEAYQGERLSAVIIFLFFNILLMAVLIIFSVLIIAFQFLLLVYLMLGIFVFLVALFPSFGMQLIKRWAMRIIGISFTKILVVFFLSVTLVFMQVIYGFTEEFGLFVTIFMMLVIIGSLWFERYRLLDLFTSCSSNINQVPQNMRKSLEIDFNGLDAIQHVRKTSLRNLENMGTDRMTAENENMQSNSQRSDSYNSQPVRLNVRNEEGSSRSYENIDSTSEKMQQSAENIRTASQDMGMYFKNAEALLQKQYEQSKASSEETASKKNEPVEYDSFVKRTDKLRTRGAGNFDNRDISNVANIMRRTVEQGGSIQEVVSNGNSIYRDKYQSIQRPESLNASRRNIDSGENPVKREREGKALKGIEYFKMNFGEEQGEELYENMTKKYGKSMMASFTPEAQLTPGTKMDGVRQQNKMSYAQIVKQMQKETENKQPKNAPETIRVREGNKQHEKQ